MKQHRIRLIAVAAAIVMAGLAGLLLVRRPQQEAPRKVVAANAMTTAAPSPVAVDQALRAARLQIENLVVGAAGEIIVVRGTARDAETIARAVEIVRAAGGRRVANLLQIRQRRNDDEIRREAERELAINPSLHDCRLAVAVDGGVLRVSGKLRTEVQEDVVRSSLRHVKGVERLETSFTTF